MEGTTFRLKTATTKSRTRSQRPRTRFRCGAPGAFIAGSAAAMTSSGNFCLPPLCRSGISYLIGRNAGLKPGLYIYALMPRRADMREAALLLRFREGGRDH